MASGSRPKICANGVGGGSLPGVCKLLGMACILQRLAETLMAEALLRRMLWHFAFSCAPV